MKEKWNIESVKNFYKNYGLTLLEDEFKNTHAKMKCVDEYGYLYSIRMDNLRHCKPLPFVKYNPYTIENIKTFLLHSKSNTQLVSDVYISNNKSLLFKCGKCSELFESTLAHLKDRNRYYCTKCEKQTVLDKQRIGIKKVKDFYKSKGYELLDEEYKNNSVNMNCITNEGYKVKISYVNLSANKKPNIFSLTHNSENYDYNIRKFIENNSLTCEYLGLEGIDDGYGHPLLKLKCECGEIFTTEQHGLTTNLRSRCPKCTGKMSHIEYKVEQWLKENNIDFEKQKRFNGCKGKKKLLPFDFYIPSVNMCIEVDGQQHFKGCHTLFDVDKTAETDNIKTNYCKNNNIKLLRIPYYQFDKDNTYKTILSNNIL